MKTTRQRVTIVGGFILLSFLVAFTQSGAQTCVQPPSGLVSWWPGDGTADDIADNNDGTLAGGATFASGRVGQAFSFDGVDDYVLVPDSPNLDFNPTSFVTVDAWVFRTSTASVQHILGKRPGCGADI